MDFDEQRQMYTMNINSHPMAGHPAGNQQAAAQQVAQVVQQQQQPAQQGPHARIMMPDGALPMVAGSRHGPMDATMATMTSQMAGTQPMTMHHVSHQQQQLVHHQQQQVIQQQQPQQQQQQQQMLAEVAVSISETSQETSAPLTGVLEVSEDVKNQDRILGLERDSEMEENDNLKESSWCLVCDKSLSVPESPQEIVSLYKATMTVSQRKLSAMLGRLIGLTLYKAHSKVLCQRCFGLVDQVDCLEIELADTKMELVQQYEATLAHRQPHEKKEIKKPTLEVDVEWEESNESDAIDNVDDDPDCTATGSKKRKRKKTKRKVVRPKKVKLTTKVKIDTPAEEESEERPRKRGRGRPRKKDKDEEESIPPNALTKSCPSCKKVILAKKYLSHLSTHRLFPCPFCDSVYKRKVQKKLGQKSIDASSSDSADCARCSQCLLDEEGSSVTFTVLKGASNRGKDLLADSLGYTYIRDKLSSQGCRWRCTIRNKHLTCCGSVQQTGFDPGQFIAGPQKHKCQPKDHASISKKQIRHEVKQQALARPYTSAYKIVNEVIQSHTDTSIPGVGLPSKETLARTANKFRQGFRRAHPPPQRPNVKGSKKSCKSADKKTKMSENGLELICTPGISIPPVEPLEQHQQLQSKGMNSLMVQAPQIQNPHVPRATIFHVHHHHYNCPCTNTNY